MRVSRRTFLLGAGAATGLAGLAAVGIPTFGTDSPLALVYRGPASTEGCPEAVAALLRDSPTGFRTEYCGPGEDLPLAPETLARAVVYAQPGGGTVDSAWRRMREHADDIRNWVRGGGTYLGFCLGGYLAGATPGFGLLPGDTDQYIASERASVRGDRDTVVDVSWRGKRETLYFQDGPIFRLRPGAPATVLATYDNGEPAAVVTPYGAGRVGVVGPHPEADESWFSDAGLDSADVHPELGHDLIETSLHYPAT